MAKKATKKFEKNHLKDTIDRRKEFAKIKQRHRLKEKKKTNKKEDNGEGPDEVSTRKAPQPGSGDTNGLANMDVDDFFQAGSISLPQKPKGRPQPAGGKRKRAQADVDDGAEDDESLSSGSIEDGALQDGSPEASMLGDGLDGHQGDLDALAQKDPEFYKYLQENDAELLAFNEDDDLKDLGELSDDEKQVSGAKSKKGKPSVEAETTEITTTLVHKWRDALVTQDSTRALRQMVLAFRAAAHLNEDSAKEFRYNITSPEVYHEVLVTALKHIPESLRRSVPVKETAGRKVHVSADSAKFRTLSPLIKSFTTSIIHLLDNLSDTKATRMTLTSLQSLLPYLLSFRKLLRLLLRPVTSIWSESSNSEATRITAFLVIRELVVIGDAGMREAVLKSTYQGLVKGSRGTTVHTLSGINLMKNSAAEIWGIDQNAGYITGYNFIRDLAMHLRKAITNTSQESYKVIYNWQYVHSLDFWSRVLASHCDVMAEAQNGKQSALRPLIYPVVQVTLGAMRLIPTAQYFPLRFQLARSLIRIGSSTGVYIPLAAPLLDVLNSTQMKKAPKPSTLKALDFSTSIRASATYLKTRIYQDGIGEQLIELISDFLVLEAKSIAFPELVIPIQVMLKRWIREVSSKTSGNKNSKLNQNVLLLVQKLEANARWIEEKRAKVNFAPNDRAEVDAFLKDVEWEKTPLGAFVVGQRKTRQEKARLLAEGRESEAADRKAAEEAER